MLPLLLLLQTTAPPRLTEFLQHSIGFDSAQLAAVERGEPVVKVLEARDRRDVAVFGIITVAMTRDAWTSAARNFPAALRTPNRAQLGIFGNPEISPDPGYLLATSDPDRNAMHQGMFYRNSAIRILQVTDGTSNTLFVGERSSNLAKVTWTGAFRSPFGPRCVVSTRPASWSRAWP